MFNGDRDPDFSTQQVSDRDRGVFDDLDYETPAARPKYRVSVIIGVLAVCIAMLGATFGYVMHVRSDDDKKAAPTTSHTPETNLAIEPKTADEAAMLSQFRLATPDEARVLQELEDVKSDPAASHIYVAVASQIVLTWIDTPLLLIMPDGHRWVSGPQGLVTFLKVPTVSLTDLVQKSALYSDPLCTLQQVDALRGQCTDEAVRAAGDWNEMLTHLRRPTVEELQSFLEPKYHDSADVNDYYIATSDLRLAPEYRFYDDPGAVLGILLPQGIRVLGGQIGFMDVMTGPRDPWALDTICFMYGGHPSLRPQTFVPAAELKRVQQGCAR